MRRLSAVVWRQERRPERRSRCHLLLEGTVKALCGRLPGVGIAYAGSLVRCCKRCQLIAHKSHPEALADLKERLAREKATS